MTESIVPATEELAARARVEEVESELAKYLECSVCGRAVGPSHNGVCELCIPEEPAR